MCSVSLDRFNDEQIHTLLAREDIALLELRRKVFRTTSKPGLMNAAVSSAKFAVMDSDISELFADPANSADRAVALTQSAKGATLVQKQALRWFIEQNNLDSAWVQHRAERHLTSRSASLGGKLLETEILQMRLFELARFVDLVSRNGLEALRDQYRGDLDHLQANLKDYLKLVVTGNPWETYLNLKQSIRDLNSLRQVLPSADDEGYLDEKNLPADLQS